MPLRRAEAAAADFTCILLSHMLWGFLLQLMRANSRQLLFLCWSSFCSSPGTPCWSRSGSLTVSEQARRSM